MTNSVYRNQSLPVSGDRIVYFNGIEVPTESVEISFGNWRFPEIHIEVPADPLLHRLGADDKIQVSVFYLDSWYGDKPEFRLLAEGEIVSWNYVRTGQSRNIRFTAVNQMAILTQLFSFFIADVDTALGASFRSRTISGRGNASTIPALPISFFYRELQGNEVVRRPIDFVLNMISSITGYISGTKTRVFSKSAEYNALLGKAREAVINPKNVKGSDILLQAETVYENRNDLTISKKATDIGPTIFSNSGLVSYIAAKLNIPVPKKSLTPQEIYNYLKDKGTVIPSDLAQKTAGALIFESTVGDTDNIDHVGVSDGKGKVIEVLTSSKSSSGDGSEKILILLSKYETPGGAKYGYYHHDISISGKDVGLSYGYIQFNQKVGTLPELMQEMYRVNSTEFTRVFGASNVQRLTTKSEFKKINFFGADESFWRTAFNTAGDISDFQKAQRNLAKRYYYDPAVQIGVEFNIRSERGIAILTDASIQRGAKAVRRIVQGVVSGMTGTYSEKELLRQLVGPLDKGTGPRRTKLLTNKYLSDNKTPSAGNVEVVPGIVKTDFYASWRRQVAFGVLPGVDYGSNTQDTGVAAKQVNADAGKRRRDLDAAKSAKVLAILKKLYPTVTLNRYTTEQRKIAEQQFLKENPNFTKQYADAVKRGKDGSRLRRSHVQAMAAVHFFQRWLKFTKFKEKFVAFPFLEDSTVDREGTFPVLGSLHRENAARALIGYGQATSGDGGSLWDLIYKIFSIMFYEIDMITAPPCLITDSNHIITDLYSDGGETDQEKLNATADSLISEGKYMRLGSYITKPNMYFGLPPSCNVYFPSMIESLSLEENYATQPTRIYINDDTQASQLGLQKGGRAASPGALMYYLITKAGYPPIVDASLQDPNKISNNNKNLMVFPVEYYKGPVVDRRQSPSWFAYLFREVRNSSALKETQPIQTKNAVSVIYSGKNIVLVSKGKRLEFEYVDDSPSTSKTEPFLQYGYLRGKPVQFLAQRIDGFIVHNFAASDFVKLKKEVKETLKQDIKILSTYRTLAEQLSLDGDNTKERVGYTYRHIAAVIEIKSNSKLDKLLKASASKYGFSYDSKTRQLLHNPSKTDIKRDIEFDVNQQKNKPKYKYVNTPLATIIGAGVYGKASQFKGQRTPQHKFYQAYAEYEFFREKFTSRVGQLDGVFNPYVVHGFPCYVLDDPEYGYHCVGYVVGGRHSLSNNGNTTSVQISNFRTYHEMFELAVAEGHGFSVGPLDPVKEVRDVTQRIDSARSLYKKLFFGNKETGKDPLGDYTKLLGWATEDGTPELIVPESGKPGYNMRYNVDLDVMPFAQELFDNTELALRYISRPVCTLREYITFYRGIKNKSPMINDGILTDNTHEPEFFSQIRDLPYGDGVQLDPSEDNITQEEIQKRLKKLPATIRDWQSVLIKYRDKVYNKKPK